ncbi:MAG TPA: SDR family oxidoreductase [Chloroflexota bacterium]|nr:SDR family oxidoreductase [Chloroflexota bacterium]
MSLDLSGRVALVTGAGRERGIGTATARLLAERGAAVFFTYWHAFDRAQPWGAEPRHPERLLADLRDRGVPAEAMEIDLSRPEAPERLLDRVAETLGFPDIVVNNAAYSTATDYAHLHAAALDLHYAVNLRAPALLSVLFARQYQGGHGRIINLVTGSALAPMPGELAYSATKGALETFTRDLSAGVAGKGITVNAVQPGPTDTGWMTEELRAAILGRSPSGRLGQPEDAARLIAFLAGDEACWITGQLIHSEGGWQRG